MWHIALGGWAAGVLVRVFWMSCRGVNRPPRPTLRHVFLEACMMCLRVAPPSANTRIAIGSNGSVDICFLFAVFCCHNPGPPMRLVGLYAWMLVCASRESVTSSLAAPLELFPGYQVVLLDIHRDTIFLLCSFAAILTRRRRSYACYIMQGLLADRGNIVAIANASAGADASTRPQTHAESSLHTAPLHICSRRTIKRSAGGCRQ
jgi:hypothetical protein